MDKTEIISINDKYILRSLRILWRSARSESRAGWREIIQRGYGNVALQAIRAIQAAERPFHIRKLKVTEEGPKVAWRSRLSVRLAEGILLLPGWCRCLQA